MRGQFPDGHHALVVVRLAGNMSIDDQSRAAQHVVDIVRAHPLRGVAELPSGPAILLAEVNDGMRGAMARMGILAVGAMALVLLFVLRVRWRLLSLGIVVTGCVWAFGLLGYLGFTLTMVTISALPVLIGLGVDFAIQMHSRFEEEAARADDPGEAVAALMRALGLPLLVAMLAAVAGFLALRLSPVPMIRDFGLMLAIGAAVLFAASLVLPATLLYRREARAARRPRASATDVRQPPRSRIAGAVRFLTTVARGSVVLVVVVTIAVAGAGLFIDRGTNVQSDPEGFIPQNSPVLTDLHRIRDVAGSSQELGFLVSAADVTRPEVLAWMADFEQRELSRHPTALLRSASIASIAHQVTGGTPTPADVDAILRAAPPAISTTFLNRDRTGAHVIFAIGPISLLDQKRLLADIERDIQAPPGVRVTAGGLAIVGIAAVDALNANRTLMIYLALGVVFLWLVAFTRSVRWAMLPIMPVLVAVGTAAIATSVLGVHLSPLSAVCGPIIVATCTEFSVLIMARYLEERERGYEPEAALDQASARIGQAFAASGLTVVGGFGALAFSGFPLLDSFGIVVALNVAVALVSALVVLPPLLLWLDRRVGATRIERHLRLTDDTTGPARDVVVGALAQAPEPVAVAEP
jgi:hydrophobe/amphiphile efflux-3 (HAE3) family protein